MRLLVIVFGVFYACLLLGGWWWVTRRPTDDRDHVSQGWCDQHKREGRH